MLSSVMLSPQDLNVDRSLPLQSQRGLTSLGTCSISANTASNQPVRKRKHDELSPGIAIGNTFTIQAHPSSASSTQLRLLPIALLDRSCLPLAYIDANGGVEDVGSRLFSARIAVLESGLPEAWHSCQTPVLIACSDSNNSFYAVEAVQLGIYALCRLGNWVTHQDIQRLRAMSLENMLPRGNITHKQANVSSNNWWRSAAIFASHNRRDFEEQKRKLAKIESFRLCPKTPAIKTPRLDPVTPKIVPEAAQEQVPFILDDMPQESFPQDTLNEVLDMIKAQYQEALYVSKTSLAYFAKGPLSRARATFWGSTDLSSNARCLIESLRSNLLSLAIMDKKYREALPSILKELPISVLTEDEIPAIIFTRGKKQRKTKRGKIGKDGLYPDEEANITRWWLSRNKPFTANESSDGKEEAIRIILTEQRARETQLQIILVLETLALEAAAPKTGDNQETPRDNAREQEASQVKKSTSKKPQNLNILLDLLVDRLCIWQSMNTDEGKVLQPAEPSATQQGGKATDNAHLRDFCVDVVLPFYGARLPEVSQMLCQKLGGPKKLSPLRPPLARAASASQPLFRPGAAMQRLQPRKPRRTLERVLTDEKLKHRMPSLSRSATDSVVPNVKREVSDTSLSAVPLNRLNIQKSKRYSLREVDLNAVSQAAEVRLKKKASVEEELRGAIAALKKPNPRMAVKEFVEAAEKRVAGSHRRKSKNPIRTLFAQGVQVTATPSKNRQKDIMGGLPRLPASSTTIPQADLEDIPPSSGLRAPDSLIKVRNTLVPASDDYPRIIQRSVLPSLGQTPTRGPSKLTNPLRNSVHASSSIERTPTRGPTKLIDPLRNLAAIGTSGLCIPLAPPTMLDQGLRSPKQLLSKSQESVLPPLWPVEVHETPSKVPPSKQSCFSLGDRSHEIPIKFQRAEEFSETTGDKPVEISFKPDRAIEVSPDCDARAVVPAALTLTEEPGRSIYESLGWDDVDELL